VLLRRGGNDFASLSRTLHAHALALLCTPHVRAGKAGGAAGATEDKYLLMSLDNGRVFFGITYTPRTGYICASRSSNQQAFADCNMATSSLYVFKHPSGPMATHGSIYSSQGYGIYVLIGKCGAFPEAAWVQGCIAAYSAGGGKAKAEAAVLADKAWWEARAGGGGGGGAH
jgi:hypothetical protein